MSFLRKFSPITISLIYILVGAIWVFLSNSFFEIYHIQGKPHALIESSQEVMFIFISGLLLFLLLKKYTDQLERTNTELKDKEILYRTLLENGGEIIGLTDKDGNITYIGSDSAFNLLGYTKEELINTSIFGFLHPDDLEKGNLIHKYVLANPGFLITEEFRIKHKSGNYIWIEAKAVNRLDDPNINGTVLNVNIIQDRKLAEERLNEGEAKNKAILATMPDQYYIINEDGKYIYTKEAEEYLFTTKGKFIGKTIFEILPPDLANKAFYYIQQAFKTNTLQVFEHQDIINNKLQCVETRIKMFSPKEVLVIVRNITDKHEAEIKIKEREALFRSTFELAAVGIVHVSLNFERIRINDKFCKILGRTKEELYSLTVQDISHPEDYEKEKYLLQCLINKEIEYYQMEKRYFKSDGTILWTNLTVSLACDELGQPQYFIAVIQDISHKKIMEQALRFKNQELNTFIYRASHDLRGPITSLIGLGRLAKYEIEEKKGLDLMDKVLITSYKLDEILLSLINLTKIQQGTVTTQLIDFDEKVSEIISQLEHLDSFAKVRFQKKINFTGEFFSDISLIRSVLQNLIENAIKYVKDDIDTTDIFLDINHLDSGVQIRIRDTGIGIQKDAQEKVFNMFYRATEKSQGSGLGLYIVKSAIDKLGGKISLYSEENIGTEFDIYIPDGRVLQVAEA